MPDFPGWEHAADFVDAYRAAVRTRSRLHKRVPKYPPIVLRTGPDEARQALQALEGALKRSTAAGGSVPCVPYAHVRPGGTRTELIEEIAEELRENTPAEMGRLRLPTYDLVRGVPGEQDVSLADRAYAGRRGRRGPDVSRRDGSSPATVTAFFLTVPLDSLRSLAERAHRTWWEWRWGVRLSRGRLHRHLWPDGFEGKRTYGAALRLFDQARRAGGDAWDGLLLAALMTDLYGQARQGLLHPGRRRRRPRHALLLDGSRSGPDAVAGFAALYGERQRTGPNPVAVVVAALPREPGAVPAPRGLGDAAERLDPARGEIPAPFEVTLPAPEPGAPARQVPPVWTPWLRVRPRPELAFEATALVLALWLTGLLAPLPWIGEGPFRSEYTACLNGSGYVRQGRPDDGDPRRQHREALEAIEEQNRVAESEGDPERTVTIALIHSSPPANRDELRSGGSIPELRGLVLAQRALHRLAPADNHAVWVRIRPYDAGVQYADAERRAREVVREAGRNSRLVGVTGFTESRRETVAAVRLLNEAKIPIVSSTATAKRMGVGLYYHGAAPGNRREAQVVGAFLAHANTVRTGDGSCVPAGSVAVVTDPADVYSDDLGKEVVREFGRTGQTGARIGYTPGAESGQTVPDETDLDMKFSMSEVAEAVCNRLLDNPRTLVYWAARVREFETFLNTFQDVSNCANRDLTVVGGNELTNAALGGGFKDKAWLHLYHTAHMLPAGHADRSATARAFNDAYAEVFGEDDLWLNDGHAALAHDSVRVLAEAARKAIAADVGLTRPDVHQFIRNGTFDLEGASGRLRFAAGSLQRPLNKLLTVLHHEREGSTLVLVCGDPGKNIDAGKEWRQGGTAYACPDDRWPGT
ncbi:hypothetical protein [Streptomyces sp. DH37]|uniref:hypothetical protein n=1 Tax=Streptomyces sp. DH37 TaxID=3040122 RepID=UPI002442A512|nr:hypothetical protein [Streptomyces sp. DH37]MDG9700708.1 hypothetical protein [Streptomyces sp. DH37]